MKNSFDKKIIPRKERPKIFFRKKRINEIEGL